MKKERKGRKRRRERERFKRKSKSRQRKNKTNRRHSSNKKILKMTTKDWTKKKDNGKKIQS